jgi:chlorobactene glucosyltransferase
VKAVLILYLLLGPIAWVNFAWLLSNGRAHMRLGRRKNEGKKTTHWPRITILIPAKDEGERIRDCIESALNQEYPDFRVITIDDRSTDRTGAVMDELATKHPNLSVVHIRDGELPAGWTGKCNALQRGVQSADGEFLLFIDSDVIIAPQALRTAILRAGPDIDLFSLLPRIETHSFFETLIIPVAGAALAGMFTVSLTNRDKSTTAFANGQFMFFRRSAYEKIGGHALVKNQYCEDIEFARHMKPLQYKVRIAVSNELASVRMYSSLSAIFRGWSRIFFAASRAQTWRMNLGIAFLLLFYFSVYPIFAWTLFHLASSDPSRWVWFSAAATHLLLIHGLGALVYRWSGNAARFTLGLPLAAAMLIVIWIKAIRLCHTGNVTWRGTVYRPLLETNEARIHL